MARPQQLPYTRKDVLRAFAMFAKDGEPEGYINPEKLEEALVRACAAEDEMCGQDLCFCRSFNPKNLEQDRSAYEG